MALSQYKRLSGCFGSLFRAASVHLAVRRMRSLTEAHISSVQRLPQQQRMRIDMHYMRNLAQPTGASGAVLTIPSTSAKQEFCAGT